MRVLISIVVLLTISSSLARELDSDDIATAINEDIKNSQREGVFKLATFRGVVDSGRTPIQRDLDMSNIEAQVTKELEARNEDAVKITRDDNGDATIELDMISRDSPVTAHAEMRRLVNKMQYELKGDLGRITFQLKLKYNSERKTIKPIIVDRSFDVDQAKFTATATQTRFTVSANLVARETEWVFESALLPQFEKFFVKFLKSVKWTALLKLLE